MAEMSEVKAKFNSLQSEVLQLNNKKIGMESEIKTIDGDMQELSKKLLEKTGKQSIEEALKFFKEQHTVLEERKTKISAELDDYLMMDEESDGEGLLG